MNEREIFAAALECPTQADRQAFLDGLGDPALCGRIEALIEQRLQLGSYLEHPPVEALAAGLDATILQGDGSTYDAANEVRSGLESMPPDPAEKDDEIPLGFLQPSTRADSRGRLAHYEILEVLGQGAFGIVLKAFDEKLQRVAAIKVLSPHLAATSPARKRFTREARASAKVRHENVVSIYAVEDEPIPYLVMEYVPGETLQKRLDDHGPLDLQDVLRLGKQIADGLAAAHAQDLIHRDVKPGNILLDTSLEDHVKITDFGLARTADDASMSQSGMIAGTPLYMAPEQALGRKLDQRADLFSFGSVLYQMLTGRPPFRAPSTLAVLKRVTQDTPRPIQEIIPEVPDWMCALVGHLHAKQPDERYGSAKEVSKLLAACQAAIEQGRVPSIPAPAHTAEAADAPIERVSVSEQHLPRAAKPAARRLLLRVAALVLVVLLAALGISEATGVSRLTSTVIRLATGSGTLVIETDDPDVKISVDGDEVTIRGGGIAQLTVRPGKHKVAAIKNGKPVKEELVTIARNGRRVVRMSLEPNVATTKSDSSQLSQTTGAAFSSPQDRLRAELVLNGHAGESPAAVPPPAVAPFAAAQAKQHQQAWANFLALPALQTNALGMKLMLIPPGSFSLRSDRRVTISKPFQMAAYETTIAQFQAFVKETGYRTSAEESGKGVAQHIDGSKVNGPEFTWKHQDVAAGDDYPVGQLSWNDAEAFCQWLSRNEGQRYRLPTSAEWEWACRAGSLASYHFGNQKKSLDAYGWHAGNSGDRSHPVGQKKPNGWGLYDVHGNVAEYCLDWTGPSETGDAVDPTGPAAGTHRTIRGRGFFDATLEIGRWGSYSPYLSMNHFGFRVVRELDAAPGSVGDLRPAGAADPDRRAAKWVLSTGGSVLVNDEPNWIKVTAELPREPFRLTLAHLYDNENVTEAGLASFQGCKHVSNLKLYGKGVSDAGIAYFKDCKELTALALIDTEVSDAGLAHFQGCRRINQLILPGSRLTDAGLTIFQDCHGLQWLDVEKTAVSDAGLTDFGDCRELHRLNVAITKVGDEGLSHFQGCTKLNHINLNDTRVTDAGLAHLEKCTELAEVHLQKTAVSDKSVPLLAKMSRLTILDVRQTRLTAEGVETLRKALPKCKIEWKGGVIEPPAAEPKPPMEAAPP